MYLQNEVMTGKTFIINDSTLPNKLPSSKGQPEVNRTRKTVLILISILLVLCFINFVFVLMAFGINHSVEGESTKITFRLLSVLLSFVYYGFGFYVTYRCYRTGLLVFAWIGYVSLLAFAVMVLIVLIVVLGTSKNVGFAQVILGATITIIICFLASLLQIFTVRYAFLLSKLLKNTKPLPTEQI